MPVPVTVESLVADSIAHAMMQRAFEADARGVDPDSLYTANAEIIANGMPRAGVPRFAGVGSNGSVQLGSSRFAVTGNFVWGTTQYRWMPTDLRSRIVEGWATLVIGRLRNGQWRILHVHSSTPAESEPTSAPETLAPPARGER